MVIGNFLQDIYVPFGTPGIVYGIENNDISVLLDYSIIGAHNENNLCNLPKCCSIKSENLFNLSKHHINCIGLRDINSNLIGFSMYRDVILSKKPLV